MIKIVSIRDCREINVGDILFNNEYKRDHLVTRNNGSEIGTRASGMTQSSLVDINGPYFAEKSDITRPYPVLISDGKWFHFKKNEIDNSAKIFHGKAYAEDQLRFKNLLDEIEKKHIDYFLGLKSIVGASVATLAENLVWGNIENRVFLEKQAGSSLSAEIFKECIDAFNSVFNHIDL